MGLFLPLLLNIILALLCSSCSGDVQRQVHVGVILHLDWFGEVANTAFQLAAEDVNKDDAILNNTRLQLHLMDSRGDPIKAASAALELLKSQVVAIVGPQTSQEAGFVAELSVATEVPMISFSATDPLLSSHRYPYFLRMANSDSKQMKAIAALIEACGWREVVVVYTDNDYGTGVLSSLSECLRDVGSEIEYRSAIPPLAEASVVREQLRKLMSMQSRVFVVHMTSDVGATLFWEAQKIGMMSGEYVWIITEGFTSLLDVLNASTIASMHGVLGTRSYIPKSPKFREFRGKWRQRFRAQNPQELTKAELNIYGCYAYDAVWMIAHALHHFFSKNNTTLNFLQQPTGIREYSNDLSQDLNFFQQGDQLLQLLLHTNFNGLSGSWQLTEGERAHSVYEIVNVIGKSYGIVGYWSEERGLSKRAAPTNRKEETWKPYDVIWPGGSSKVPRGWATPTNSNVLKIGVPVKRGFEQFISFRLNETTPSGFVIDVFDSVRRRLQKRDGQLPHQFIPFGAGQVTPSYDDLVYQVYLKKFDAVVADVTILANRSNYVDFTQPFSESGLVMVVPIRKSDSSNAWAFMRPFTPDMWCGTGAFFLFTGVVVWLLEHKRNTSFRGKPKKQVLTLLWFSFSTMFFSQRERIVSSLGRLVVIIWLFVVLILTSSYTASLTSILTVQQMEPTIEDIDSLKASKMPIGYQAGSFVKDYLQKQLGIDKNKLVPYSSLEKYAEALSKGPHNGGVAAIFDEIPYIRVFLSTQCGYTMVGPTYRTGGLGFVFPKGFPLVSDISRAVLELSENKEMQRIEKKWFNKTACYTKQEAQIDSNRLSMENFWGLFLISGTASAVALVVYLGRLIYRYIHRAQSQDEEYPKSISRHLKSFVEYVDKKEPSKRERVENNCCQTPTPVESPMNSYIITTFSLDEGGAPA
eukprot:Gb_26917 [translate_table: standard]